ncbi:MAG: SGNH/GDSL hydrolase family protein [Caldicoprobacterales bacterium]|jgi:acyl-CoA thioesterase-1|nr:SGNH/GDSL hydrolase family protein [Clostridiales bacterium]
MSKRFLVLFQGDSITDCGRNRENHNSLGSGYAMMSAALFQSQNPELDVKFLNRGISGNRAINLLDRWKEDCLDLKPDLVSILIGINETGHGIVNKNITTPEAYAVHYRKLLTQIRENLDTKIIIMEPFLLHVNEEKRTIWRDDLNPRIRIVRELAREFKAYYIPLDGIFAAASTLRPPEFWAADGVHPTPAGHALISRHWLGVAEPIIKSAF